MSLLRARLFLVCPPLISAPITGVLVRLKANYNPRILRLDPEGNIESRTGPAVTSFFGMFGRVKRIEGWGGLYKGLMPMLFFILVHTSVDMVVSSARSHSATNIKLLLYGPFRTLLRDLLFKLVFLQTQIIIYRSIATPYKLPYFRPEYSLRVLLTPAERRKPWMLYMIPGILAAEVLGAVCESLLDFVVGAFLGPRFKEYAGIGALELGTFIVVEVLRVVIVCPLQTITIKLAVQRNHAAPEYNLVEQALEVYGAEGEEYAEHAGAEEDVIHFRHEIDPYSGLVDCARCIINEEGWSALYRAWWIMLLSGHMGSTKLQELSPIA